MPPYAIAPNGSCHDTQTGENRHGTAKKRFSRKKNVGGGCPDAAPLAGPRGRALVWGSGGSAPPEAVEFATI